MKTYKELLEKINMTRAKMGDVIKDFQDSDAPQFKGKSMEKRRQMAIAAKLEADRDVKEETEELEELDTATLKSYRTKARAQGNAIVDKMKMGGGDWSKDQKDTKTLRKRAAGAQMSGKKLVKRGESLKTEEIEQIDELSPATKASYVKKASGEIDKLYDKSKTDSRSAYKYYGRKNTMRKIANEETELDEGRMKELVTKHMDAGHDYDSATKKAKKDLEKMKNEELKGNQHKIDANKNGKVDGHDFKILRNAKKARYQ